MNLRSCLPVLLSLSSLIACDSETPDAASTTVAKTTIATVVAGGLTVGLLADGVLRTGLNTVYVSVAALDGTPVLDAAVEVLPLMAMATGKQHACPVLGPAGLGPDGLYRTGIVFQMAATATDVWSATVRIVRPDGSTTDAGFAGLAVADSGRARTFTALDPATGTTHAYVASLNLVGPARVGLNEVVVTLHVKQDMTTFPPVDDAVLTLDPQMPSMGHGSPGSVPPAWQAPGQYLGQLSFSMPGDWETTLTVARAGAVLGTPVFSLDF